MQILKDLKNQNFNIFRYPMLSVLNTCHSKHHSYKKKKLSTHIAIQHTISIPYFDTAANQIPKNSKKEAINTASTISV